MRQRVIKRVLLILPAVVFWTVICFIPHGSGENYVHLLSWEAAGILSTILLVPSLYFALQAPRDVLWWLVSAINLSPTAWFFITLVLLTLSPQPDD